MKRGLIIFLILMVVLMVAGCVTNAANPKNIGTTDVCTPLNYGNGVLYFPCTEEEFGNSLSMYLEYNNVEIQAMSVDVSDMGYGTAYGYWVVLK